MFNLPRGGMLALLALLSSPSISAQANMPVLPVPTSSGNAKLAFSAPLLGPSYINGWIYDNVPAGTYTSLSMRPNVINNLSPTVAFGDAIKGATITMDVWIASTTTAAVAMTPNPDARIAPPTTVPNLQQVSAGPHIVPPSNVTTVIPGTAEPYSLVVPFSSSFTHTGGSLWVTMIVYAYTSTGAGHNLTFDAHECNKNGFPILSLTSCPRHYRPTVGCNTNIQPDKVYYNTTTSLMEFDMRSPGHLVSAALPPVGSVEFHMLGGNHPIPIPLAYADYGGTFPGNSFVHSDGLVLTATRNTGTAATPISLGAWTPALVGINLTTQILVTTPGGAFIGVSEHIMLTYPRHHDSAVAVPFRGTDNSAPFISAVIPMPRIFAPTIQLN